MNKVIRSGVFETNSSSTHSITLAGWPPAKKATLPVDDGVVSIFPGEFGWEEMEYTDAPTKASYCYTFAKQMDQPDLIKRLGDVIKAETGCRDVQFETSDSDYYPHGYIDHQSCEDNPVCEMAFKSDTTLRNFIFNPKSILVTDNDNH